MEVKIIIRQKNNRMNSFVWYHSQIYKIKPNLGQNKKLKIS